MTFRWVPSWPELDAWLSKGWRLARRPYSHHARYRALVVREEG